MKHKAKIKRPLTKGAAKVPMIMQLEALECGAACLTMIMAYYNKWIPLEKVRSDCGVSRDGTKAKNILIAARSYGFEAGGFLYEPEALKAGGSFPCIIHWNFNHFVVLCGFKRNHAVLNDPARGTITVTMEEFDRAFTGVCLLFEPGKEFYPSGQPKQMRVFVKKRLQGAGPSIAFVAVTTLISALTGIIAPAFPRVLMDRLLTKENPEWFLPFMLLLCTVYLIQVIVSAVETLYRNKMNGKLAAIGSASFFWKVLHMPMDFFSQRMAGDIQERQIANASIADILINTFAPLALNGIMTIVYFAVMIRYSVTLTLVGVSSIIINAAVGRYISKKRTNIMRVQMRDTGKLISATISGIEMIETIKANGAEYGFFERWSGYQASVNSQQVKFLKINHYLGLIPSIVSSLCSTAVLILGVWFIMEGHFTVGMLMTFQMFLNAFTVPAVSFISADQTIQEMRTNMERVDDVMEYPEDPCYCVTPENDTCAKLRGNIEIQDVSFGYARLGEPVIRDFNLTLTPGKSVALVGASGCGKSTISKLISGLYQPWTGEILFDGKPQSRIDRDVFTGSLAVIDQEIVLFEDTIANNIKMWDSSIEDFEMILAARDAQLHEDILQREGGYHCRLSEGGSDLSGGQRQRMEIARVLAQDPTIIIMDEATSALDAKTEFDVVKAIRDRGVTLIIVAHRLSTIRDCDEILVLDHGRIVERGTHSELYARGGHYTELVVSD